MRKVYYTLDLTEAVLLKDHLLHHGVTASVSNKGAVRIPHEGIASEVWVGEDAEDNVRTLIHSFLQQRQSAPGGHKPAWLCPDCREDNPATFEVCWSCGQERQTGGESTR